ncbi:hypothetical protein D3C77_28340 [compost metagenome]
MFPIMPSMIRPVSVMAMSQSGYMHRTPELLLSLQPFYLLSKSQQIITTRYWISKRYSLLGRLEKSGMKNIRVKI